MLSSLFQIVMGFSGLTGVLLRFIGPITVAPTISLVGISLSGVCSDYAGILNYIFLLYLSQCPEFFLSLFSFETLPRGSPACSEVKPRSIRS